jgi:hypothetical protein
MGNLLLIEIERYEHHYQTYDTIQTIFDHVLI